MHYLNESSRKDRYARVCVYVCVAVRGPQQKSTHVCDWHMLNPSLPDWEAVSRRESVCAGETESKRARAHVHL